MILKAWLPYVQMGYIAELIEQYGIIIVFINVLLGQLGLLIPAYPTLVLAGALISPAEFPFPLLLATAVVAALIADVTWYLAGQAALRPGVLLALKRLIHNKTLGKQNLHVAMCF